MSYTFPYPFPCRIDEHSRVVHCATCARVPDYLDDYAELEHDCDSLLERIETLEILLRKAEHMSDIASGIGQARTLYMNELPTQYVDEWHELNAWKSAVRQVLNSTEKGWSK
jgi:hypothetical protein